MALAVIKIAPLVLLVAVGLFAVRASNLHWVDAPTAANIGQTAMLLFFAFMGTEGALTASGEVVNPARTVPRAILLALTLVAALYIGLQVVAQGVLGAELPNAAAPLVATATAIFGPWGTRLLLATTFLSVRRLSVRRHAVLSAEFACLGGATSIATRPGFSAPTLQDAGACGRSVFGDVCPGRLVGIVPSTHYCRCFRYVGALPDLLSRLI